MDRAGALALLGRAPVVHVASVGDDGGPILKTVHGVLVDGALCFHGAPAGEKTEAIGRPAVVSAEEIVAEIPSYWVDPERACPATTYYLSAQAHGVIEWVDEPAARARVLAALMARYQPEGGHVPIDAEHPLYRAQVAKILVCRIALDRLDGKGKLGQNRTPAERARVLAELWRRGRPGDVRAIELVREANLDTPDPAFLAPPAPGLRLSCALGEGASGEHDLAQAVALLAPLYWNYDASAEIIARAQTGSVAWVGARDADGTLVATARATSDGAKYAWIYDVAVADAWRGRGVGTAVVRMLLDHPAVRGARRVLLGTRDAQKMYARLGFTEDKPYRPFPTTTMVLARS